MLSSLGFVYVWMLMLTYIQQDSTKCLINMPAHLIVVLDSCCPKSVVDF